MKSKKLQFYRMVIAGKEVKHKTLARRCGVSRSQFSLMMHGDVEMPEDVENRLIQELELEDTLEKLRAMKEVA